MSGNGSTGREWPQTTHGPTTGIFLSYRRGDPVARVGRLYDRLVSRFGRDRIFRDIDSAVPASNFELVIDRALTESRVLIAVIGPTWLTVTDAKGQRRLDDPDDYVRYELAKALHKSDCEVLPVLRGAPMPAADDLPEELRPLTTLQAIRVDDDDEGPHFEFDAQQVVDAVARLLGEQSSDVNPDIILGTPNLLVKPGQSAETAVVARNIGSDPADVALSYEGPDWARLRHGTEPAGGGRELRSTLVASPPRTPDLPARTWPYTIEATDQHGGRLLAQAHGNITTEAFRDTQVTLAPARVEIRRASTLSLTVTNSGNVDLNGRVLAAADGMDLDVPDHITLEPGGEQTYQVNATSPRRRLLGRPVEHPLSITVAVDGEPHPHVRHATVHQRPLVRTRFAVLVAAVLIVPLGLGLWQAREAEAKRLPDVTPLAQAEAVGTLEADGFEVEVVPEETSAEDAGQVLRTDPAPETDVSLDEPIRVFVAAEPPVQMPDVTDETKAAAEAALKAAGFTDVTASAEETTDEGHGQVLRTEPEPGTEVSLDAMIRIYVAKSPLDPDDPDAPDPPQMYEIPDVAGLTYPGALDILPGPLDIFDEYEHSNEVANGLVIRTEPQIGTSHPAGTHVDVVISTGPVETVPVPSLVGMDAASAEAVLSEVGLAVSTQQMETCDSPTGLVIGQTPDAGAEVDPTATVEITIADEPPNGCGG